MLARNGIRHTMHRPADQAGSVQRASRATRWLRTSIVLSVLLPALIFALAGWQSRLTALAGAETDVLGAAALVAEHVLRVLETNTLALDAIDRATRGLTCDEMRASTAVPATLAGTIRHSPQIEAAWVIDERGMICAVSRPDRYDDTSRADRDYFLGARDSPRNPATGEPDFYISRGLIGRIGGVPFFSLSRRRLGEGTAADAFTGIVLASVELHYMFSYWHQILLRGAEPRIALFRTDGALIVRSDEPAVRAPDAALEARIAATWAKDREGVARGRSPNLRIDQVRAWKVLPAWNLAVIAALDTADILQPWRTRVAIYGAIAVLTSLALIGVSATGLRWVHYEEAAAQQAHSELMGRLDAEERLRQAQKMEAIGQLSGGVAHDFNNLLMAMMASVELLRKRLSRVAGAGDDARVARLLDAIDRSTQRGASLTQRMLSFARRQQLNPVAVDVSELVQGMSDLLQRSLGPLVRIETHFPVRPALAHVDPHQLEIALLNLALNARDALAAGGRGTVTITVHEETIRPDHHTGLKEGFYVCLSVTDNGAGMDAATLARATEPFFTTKAVGKGTGLGLSMVHGLVEQSGGRLVLKSRKGEGTTAELWLPHADLADVGSDDAMSGQVQRSAEPARSPARTVLVVDDDPLVLSVTTDLLADLGHVVVQALSGPEAVKIARASPGIDLVIADYAMPDMTGAQLAAELRTMRPGLPVILATGYAEQLPGAGDAGPPCLAKPFTQRALAQAIAENCPVGERHRGGIAGVI
jgi:signal transduction histidine kinase